MTTWLFTLSAYNSFEKYINRNNYKHELFEITDITYYFDDENGTTKWLDGQIHNNQERYVPNDISKYHSKSEIMEVYKIGTKIPVLYNFNLSKTIMQGETLRVISPNTDFKLVLQFSIKYIFILLIPSIFVTILLFKTKPVSKKIL